MATRNDDDPLGLFSGSGPRTTVPRAVVPIGIAALAIAGVVWLLSGITTPAAPPKPVIVNNLLLPSHSWTDTFIDVARPFVLVIDGQIMGSTAAGSALNRWSGPMGWREPDVPEWLDKDRRLAPQFPYLSVLGKVNNGEPFFVGARLAVDPQKHGRGRLYLGLNEVVRSQFGDLATTHYTDNGGSFRFTVHDR